MGFARRNLTTILVAMVTAAVTAGGPAIAATIADYARNADKVDGKHAVAAGSTVANRKGKLVATSATTGRLPDNIIAKAPDAQKLDGFDNTAFLKVSETAANSELLGGKTSSDFLGAQDTAWDSEKLGGRAASDYALTTHTHSNYVETAAGNVEVERGAGAVVRAVTGDYMLEFGCPKSYGNTGSIVISNLRGSARYVVVDGGGSDPTALYLTGSGGESSVLVPTAMTEWADIRFTSPNAVTTLSLSIVDDGGPCKVQHQVLRTNL